MASGKVKKSSAKKTKTHFILGLVIALIVICIAGYFVHMSGLLQRTFTGVKITETAADGTSTTVMNYSVVETNYHFNELYSMYSMYGMIDKAKLDEKVEESSEDTWREYLYKAAADEMMENALILRAAENDTTKPEFGYSRYIDQQIEVMKQQAEQYNYNSFNQYLQAMHGTGFNTFDYKKIMGHEILAKEYDNYVKQYVLVPSDADIQTKFDNDPNAYRNATYNYYLFSANMDDQGNYTNLDQTKADAKEVADAVNSGKTFKAAVKAVLEKDPVANETALLTFGNEEADPTLITGYSKTTAEYVFSKAPAVLDAIYGPDAVMGKAIVVETDNGTYVVCPVELSIDETATVSYRTLTISNTDYAGANTEASVLASGLAKAQEKANSLIASPMDSKAFADLVRKNSDDGTEIISAGYVSGQKPSTTTVTAEGEEESAAEKALNAWLFDSARKPGDTIVINADDSSKVTIYYFESSLPAWKASVKSDISDTLYEGWKADLKAGNPGYEINYGTAKLLFY